MEKEKEKQSILSLSKNLRTPLELKNRNAAKRYVYIMSKKGNGKSSKNTFNIRALNKKGFFDDLVNYDDKLEKSKLQLEQIKSNAIKECVYTNKKIPLIWQNKISYAGELFNTLDKDKNLVNYLGRSRSTLPSEKVRNEIKSTLSQEKENEKNENEQFISKEVIEKNGILEEDDEDTHTHNNTITKNNNLNYNSNGSLNVCDCTTNVNVNTTSQDIYSNLSNTTNSNILHVDPLNKNKNNYYEDNDNNDNNNLSISHLLEEYRKRFPIRLKKERETLYELPKSNAGNNNNRKLIKSFEIKKIKITPSKMKSQSQSRNLVMPKIINRHSTEEIEEDKSESKISSSSNFGYVSRKKVFKSTIYDNILQDKSRNNALCHSLSSANMNNSPFTYNFGNNEFFKKIEIKNQVLNNQLKEINFYGPIYAHCYPCWKRTAEFYNNLGIEQSMKLVNYLKKYKESEGSI